MYPRYKTGFFGGKFLPFHQGHLHCIMRAASQCDKLYVVLMHHGIEELRILGQAPPDAASDAGDPCGSAMRFPARYLNPRLRELAMRRELAPFSNIEVISYDCRPAYERSLAEGRHPWHYECADMVALMGRFDAAFSSEAEYDANFRRFYPHAHSVVLDSGRGWPQVPAGDKREPLSGTLLRSLPFSQAYAYLPRAYQQLVNKSVLIAGTESCGKSVLVRKLAAVFNTSFTEEQGRLVSESYGVDSPGIEFYNGFLYSQKAREQAAREQANRVFFCDTDAIATQFFARRYEGADLPIARAMAAEADYDLVIYLEPTVPWVGDGMRSDGDPALRTRNDARLKELYRQAGMKLCVLSGDYESNYLDAVAQVSALLDE